MEGRHGAVKADVVQLRLDSRAERVQYAIGSPDSRGTHGLGSERGPVLARQAEAGVQFVAQVLGVFDSERDEPVLSTGNRERRSRR